MDVYYSEFPKKKNRYSGRLQYDSRPGVRLPDTRRIKAAGGISADIRGFDAAGGTSAGISGIAAGEILTGAGIKNGGGTSALPRTSALRGRIEAFIERILCLLDTLVDTLSSQRTLTIIRVSVSVVCFFTVVGVIGGIESGAIGWGTGIIAALVAAVVEAACIRKRG